MTIARPLNVRVGYIVADNWRLESLDRCAANAAPYTLALHIRAFEPLGTCTRLVWDSHSCECFAIALHNDFTLTTLLPPRLATFLVARDAVLSGPFHRLDDNRNRTGGHCQRHIPGYIWIERQI